MYNDLTTYPGQSGAPVFAYKDKSVKYEKQAIEEGSPKQKYFYPTYSIIGIHTNDNKACLLTDYKIKWID